MNAPFLRPEEKKRKRSWLLRFLGWTFAVGAMLFLAGSAVAGYLLWSVSKDLPDYEALAKYEPPVMTRIHASDGSLLDEFADERRIFVPINTVPKLVIQAYLSAEDKNFFQHPGLDFRGIVSAVLGHYIYGRQLRGASTITQQVAKNFLLTNERSFERKLKEAILAVRIEKAFSKEQILELYLNEIYLGYFSYGVAAAALNYYGKELEELTISEAAYLAALPKAPNNYHPFRKTKRAIARRNWVIGQMQENGFITREQRDAEREKPLGVNPRPFGAQIFAAEFFAEDVRRELVEMFGENKYKTGGYSVRTTLDPEMQRMAKKALVDGLVQFDRRKGWRGVTQQVPIDGDWGAELAKLDPPSDIKPWRMAVVLSADDKQAQIGLRPAKLRDGKVATQRDTGTLSRAAVKWAKPKRGRVDALLSPGDVIYVSPVETKKSDQSNDAESAQGTTDAYELMQIPEIEGAIVAMDPHTGRIKALVGGFSFEASQFDRATQAKRQPGSSFKPFVYAAALDNGYKPTSVVLDAPIAIEQGGGQGIWKPENYGRKFYGPSTLRLGIELSRNLMTVRLTQDMGMPLVTEYARRFGIYDNLLPVLSMALGAGETTLVRMVGAYGMLANGGKKVEPTLIDRIQDRYGRTIWRHDKRECVGCKAEAWKGQPEPELGDARQQIIDPHTAYQMTSIMQGVVERGTGTRVKAVGKPIAGKTGTTNDEKDAWFVGYSPDLVVGVYVGYDTPKPMGKGETGGALAAPIFRDFMKMALADKPAIPFRIPPGIKLVRVDRKTGLRTSGGNGTILEAFKPEEEPDDVYSAIGYTSGGGSFQNIDPNASIGRGRGVY